ncbi:Imm21 family immunity protein [Ideonella oryzae]|uniref:Immunity 21 family protein n=1 Tax=Ideonella oryzae TaxID=2937441 RepID=A0ABT1BRR8_9BURK|nr:immunity 21 family protein [Ideonella oryzae]
MKSIVSGGGPLVCVEMEVVNRWRGLAGNSVSGDIEPDFPNDYKRACAVSDYLGKVSVGDRDALVLGDMPLETLIWTPLGELPRIVRVYYGDPGVDVASLLEKTIKSTPDDPDEMLPVEFKSSLILVFDAACLGSDASIDRLSFEVPVGRYIAMTKHFQPDNRTSVLVHFFVPSQ